MDSIFKSFIRLLSRGKLTVLVFHKVPRLNGPLVSGDIDLVTFDRVVNTVSKLFRIIPLDEAVLGLRAGNLPERAACITFDDGYADWLHGVVPSLLRYQVHATFFVTSGQFSGLPIWNERILHAMTHAPCTQRWLELPNMGLPKLPTGNLVSRSDTLLKLDGYFKYKAPAAREELLQALECWAGVELADVPTMSVADLQAIHGLGFGIGSHTLSHPILTSCTLTEALHEMVQAREELEFMIKGRVTGFAYPNGIPGVDFSSEHIELARRAGYTYAVTTHWGVATSATSVFQIPRFTPWGPSAAKMSLQLARNLVRHANLLPESQLPKPLKLRQRKVLMVAFHFPPQTGSSGILRTLNFVKYLPQNGWTPTVLTASGHAYLEKRNDLMAAVPTDTRVLRAFSLDASRHFTIAKKYPLALALPDRWSSWWLCAVVLGMREIRKRKPDLIWSTYPISTAHLIAFTLARMSGLPWVADFRDPMVSNDYPAHRLHRRILQKLESYVMHYAAACVFTTERAAITYGQRHPAVAAKCKVIENGYDEEVFVDLQPDRHGIAEGTLFMLHSGVIYPKDRNPSTFFEAVHQLIRTGQLNRNHLRIRFRAPHHDAEVRDLANLFGLADVVDIAPPIAYHQAIAEMKGADILLVFQGGYFNAQIPAKIYEYLRVQRPILAVLDPAGDTAKQLRHFKMVHYGNIEKASDIQTALVDWLCPTSKENELLAYRENLSKVMKFSRDTQAIVLSDLLSELAAPSFNR